MIDNKQVVNRNGNHGGVHGLMPASNWRPEWSRLWITLLLSLILLFASLAPALSQSRMSLIRDSEIERTLRSMAEPILQVAGIAPTGVRIHIVADSSLNAFVMSGQNIFLHTGLMLDARNPGELIAVIAHEAGHIAGGHLARGQERMDQARRNMVITSLLGMAAAIASGDGRAGAAVMTGGMSMAERDFLAYSRAMESSADQAALSYLDRLGWSAEGMGSFLGRLEDQDLLPSSRQSAYTRTHPLARDRLQTVHGHIQRSRATGSPLPGEFDDRFARMQAKLLGFMQPQQALQRYSIDDRSIAARYGRAIANFRRGDLATALEAMNNLIAEEPNNPFFHELLGQMLFENGRIDEARAPYRRAQSLAPGEPLIGVAYAQTLVASDDPATLREAISLLERSTGQRDGQFPLAWRLLATAYGKIGEVGQASVALAEEAIAMGNREQAREQARRAQSQLPTGSAGWLKAQDILSTTEN